MRFFRRRSRPLPSALPEAKQARLEAEEQLAETQGHTPRYRALSDTLRNLRQDDVLGRVIEETFLGGHKR